MDEIDSPQDFDFEYRGHHEEVFDGEIVHVIEDRKKNTEYVMGCELGKILNRHTFNIYRTLREKNVMLVRVNAPQLRLLRRSGLVKMGTCSVTLVPMNIARKLIAEKGCFVHQITFDKNDKNDKKTFPCTVLKNIIKATPLSSPSSKCCQKKLKRPNETEMDVSPSHDHHQSPQRQYHLQVEIHDDIEHDDIVVVNSSNNNHDNSNRNSNSNNQNNSSNNNGDDNDKDVTTRLKLPSFNEVFPEYKNFTKEMMIMSFQHHQAFVQAQNETQAPLVLPASSDVLPPLSELRLPPVSKQHLHHHQDSQNHHQKEIF